MIFRLRVGKKWVNEDFAEPSMAYLAALGMVKENNDLVVDVLCKKNIRFRRCFRATKENYQMQTIRVGVIGVQSRPSETDFFKMMMGKEPVYKISDNE